MKNVFEEDCFDLVVLDEVIIGIRDGFLEEKKLLETIGLKPNVMEVILTGRGASDSLIEFADLVSEIRERKHPYATDVEDRRAIEY